MQYRKMGTLDWKVSVLGFGAMRLPVKGQWNNIDEDKAGEMISYAIDNGINYVDTAWGYHDGSSEEFLGRALKNGYREKVKLVTKSPVWLINSGSEFISFFEKQLKKLNTEYLDIYLFHGLNADKWEKVKQLHLLDEMKMLKSTGKIRHIGFSFHGSYETFKEIIDYYPWDVTMIQYNYMDIDFQATTSGLDYAYSKNVAVVVMEPLRGGKLAQSNPEIENILRQAPVRRKPVEWALQFVWNHPGVATVLSGMGTLEQVKENMDYASDSGPNSFTIEESEIIGRIRNAYTKRIKVLCTNCQYCMPCPEGVDIPENFNLINHAAWEGKVHSWMKKWYNELADPDVSTDWHGKGQASKCISCGECLDKCPQKIDIPSELEEVRRMFEMNS